jgi:hypothetical protein
MGLPIALQKQAEEADALYKEAYPQNHVQGDEQETSPQVTPANGNTDGNIAPPQISEETPAPAPGQDAVTPDAAPQDITATELSALRLEYEKLLHSHNVLKGKYNAEVHADVNNLINQIAEKDSQISELQKRIQTASLQNVQPAAKEIPGEIKQRLIEEYGEVHVQDMEALISSLIATHVGPLQKSIKTTEAAVVQNESNNYMVALAKLAPNWRKHKDDPRFLEFLNKVDGDGLRRYDKASNAANIFDAVTVAGFYNDFEKSVGNNGGPPPDKDTPPPNQPKGKEGLISPQASRQGQMRPPDKPYYNASQLRDFAADVAKGKYKGKDAERIQIEAAFNDAIRENRIILGA